jgi:aryl-alcohol dehydrogenase-like predicted oxidoreductase
MSFGDTSRGFSEWSLGYDDARPFFQQAVELGVTFWDTANVYGFGSSEEIVGRALQKYSRREDIVLATKVHFRMHDGPGGSGLSRKAIMSRSTPHWPAWTPTMSISTRSTALTPKRRSRRPWRRSTMS